MRSHDVRRPAIREGSGFHKWQCLCHDFIGTHLRIQNRIGPDNHTRLTIRNDRLQFAYHSNKKVRNGLGTNAGERIDKQRRERISFGTRIPDCLRVSHQRKNGCRNSRKNLGVSQERFQVCLIRSPRWRNPVRGFFFFVPKLKTLCLFVGPPSDPAFFLSFFPYVQSIFSGSP
jgi:hypothetical protein